MKSILQDCNPLCESFQCTMNRGSLKLRTRSGKKEAWCTTFDDLCDGGWCQYGRCEIRKLSDGNKCNRGRQFRLPENEAIETPFVDPSRIPDKYEKKLRSKMKT